MLTVNARFQIKAAAIINSSFREILYLDSDNAPTRDPSYLFHSKGYTETGAIFWPDFWYAQMMIDNGSIQITHCS